MIGEFIATNVVSLMLVWFVAIILGLIWALNKKICISIMLVGIISYIVILMWSLSDGHTPSYGWNYCVGYFIGGLTARLIAEIGIKWAKILRGK